MKYILYIVLVVLNFGVKAQQSVIFEEDFESYDNDWEPVYNEEFVVKQEDGKLFISKATQNSIKNGCLWYKKTIPQFDTSKDLSIKFDANSISSEAGTVGFDIQWGKIYEADGVRLTSIHQLDFVSNSVRLSQFELNKGGWKYYPWSNELNDASLAKFTVERNSFHSYEIIQSGKILNVVIDGKLVYKIAIEPKIGSEIGFPVLFKKRIVT